jgi:hypothetical protein
MARAFLAFIKERAIQRVSRGLIFELAADHAPKATDADHIPKSDVPWLDRFAAAGGHAVISGDVKMRRKTHEKLALYNHGFVVIFFEPQWAGWNSFRKSALMLHWWEEITNKIKTADEGTFWVVPCAWPTSVGQLRNASLGLAKLLKDAPGKRKERPKRKRFPNQKPGRENRQSTFVDKLAESRRDDKK